MADNYPLITIDLYYTTTNSKSCLMTHGTIKEAAMQTKTWIEAKRCAVPEKIEIVCYDADANALYRECIDPATLFA